MEIWLILVIIAASILGLMLFILAVVQCCVYKRNKRSRNIQNQVILVTGGTGGIGEIFWKDFYANGATLIFTGRSKNKVEVIIKDLIYKNLNKSDSKYDQKSITDLRNGKWTDEGNFESDRLYYFKMDQSSLGQCKKFCESFNERFKKLDVLFLNAGLYVGSEKRTEDDLEYTMGVNHYSHFYITSLLIPLIKATKNSRIISTSSVASKKMATIDPKIDLDDIEWKKNKRYSKYDASHRYATSKFANVAFTNALADYLVSNKVEAKAICFHPGVVRTGFFNNLENRCLECIMSCVGCYLRSQEMGAQTGLYTVYSRYDQITNGVYYDNCKEGKMNPDAAVQSYYQKFWNVSLELLEERGFSCDGFTRFGQDLELV